MPGSYAKAEVLPGPEHRRSWSSAEKLSIVQETYGADMTVSLVARRHGVAPNQLFRWRKLAAQGASVAARAQDDVVAAWDYRALQAQKRELHRLLGKKTLETEILEEALEVAAGPKKRCCARCRGPRTVRGERRLHGARRRLIECRRGFDRASSQASRSSTATGRRSGRRDLGRDR